MTDGYRHPDYARSLDEGDDLIVLHASGSNLLQRSIPRTTARDLKACYPFLCCEDWSALAGDLDGLGTRFVAVAAVTDPFGAFDPDDIGRAFDFHRLYKMHQVVDLTVAAPARTSAHHRREVQRSLGLGVSVDRCIDSPEARDEWNRLYANLILRHSVTGELAFSRRIFDHQFRVPGFRAYRARQRDETVGMSLWFVSGEVAYYHLGACSDAGYRSAAAYALMRSALDDLAASGARWASLGAGAGTHARQSGQDGLVRFKSGWANAERPVFFCGRILNRELYDALSARSDHDDGGFFPAYRAPTLAAPRPDADGRTRDATRGLAG